MTWWLGWVCASAIAADVVVTPREGTLHHGRVHAVDVAVREGDTWVRDGVRLLVDGEAAVPVNDAAVADAVHRFWVQAPPDGDRLSVEVRWPGGVESRRLAVDDAPASALEIVPLSDGADGRLRFDVRGADVPAPEALQIVTSEGQVRAVTPRDGGLRVSVSLDDRDEARWWVVGVKDLRRDVAPTWASLPLRARASVPVDTTPGASVTVTIDGTTFGPVVADETGKARLEVAHGPDARSGRVRIVDPVGNVATGPVPLSVRQVPTLMAFVGGSRRDGESPPDVVLRGVRTDGGSWRGGAPTCRSSRFGALDVIATGVGVWRVSLPAVWPEDAFAVRATCRLGTLDPIRVDVPVDEGTPQRLWARMWPDTLSSDYPVGSLQLALENTFGVRLAPEGTFEASAALGTVHLDPPDGPFVSGVYQGDAALASGADVVSLAWFAPPGVGHVDSVSVYNGAARAGGEEAWVRVLDGRRRPLVGVPVEVFLQGQVLTATTEDGGWATVTVPIDMPPQPIRVRAAGREAWGVWAPGLEANAGPGRPDRRAEVDVVLDAGRVAEVALTLSPTTVKAGPGARGQIRAVALDRDGKVASEVAPTVEVSEGSLSEPTREADGTWSWTYRPPGGFRHRDVVVLASDGGLGVDARKVLRVRAKPIDRWVSLSAGVQTNFGRITSPFVAFDAAWRIRLGPRDAPIPPGRAGLMVRAGLGWYGASATTAPSASVDGELRMDVMPVHVGLVLRQAYPVHAYWFSLGGVAAPFVGSAAYGGVVVTRRFGVLPPGLVARAGYGVRVPGGEVAFELSGTVLTSPGSDISFEGQVGGLAVTVGYRVGY